MKTPPTLRLDKTQQNLVKELIGLARLSIEQKQFQNERVASSSTNTESKNEEAEEPPTATIQSAETVVIETPQEQQGNTRLPCERPFPESEQRVLKKPRLNEVSVNNQSAVLVPDHIVAAKVLSLWLSDAPLKEYHLHGKVIWKKSNKLEPIEINSTHRRKAAQIELLLNTVASQDSGMASCILRCLLEKRDFENVQMDLQDCWLKEKKNVDMHIVKNIREFLKYHKNPKGGTLQLTIAAAIEAVETAVMFPCGEIPPPVNKILESIGYSRWRPANRLLEIRERALAMMNEGKYFEPSTRAMRVDCYIDKAAQCILKYSHSDEHLGWIQTHIEFTK